MASTRVQIESRVDPGDRGRARDLRGRLLEPYLVCGANALFSDPPRPFMGGTVKNHPIGD